MKTLSAWALAGLLTPSLLAQEQEVPARGIPDASAELANWRASHGEAWRLAVDPDTGFAEMLYGGNAPALYRPNEDHDWIAVARDFLGSSVQLHGIDGGTLVHDEGSVRFLPLGVSHGGTDKMTVSFRQVLGATPVVDGTVNVLMDMEGRLLSIQSTASPFLAEVDPGTTLSEREAAERAIAVFGERTGLAPTWIGGAALVVKQADRTGLRLPWLAWQIDVGWKAPDTHPEAWTYWIEAHDGSLVDAANLIHFFDVGGTLDSMATPGTRPDKANNPEVAIRMPYARITAGANTATSDRNGVWNFPGLSGPLSCTFEFRGTFNRVLNDAGAEYTLTLNANTGSGNAILMNPASSDAITAAANAYLHVNTVRDYIRDTDSGDSHADFLALSNVNIASTCNAFFDGASVNYYSAGGGCVNTAYSTVVAHEYGHWLNVLYGTGNGSDGMGEGNADVWAMYTFDDPIVGFDFCGTGCHVRTGTNNRQFCGDSNGGCYGGVHADGEVWMGAAWKVRDRLNTSLGNSAGDLVADTRFVGWMNAYNQTQIKSIIETQWLTLDDNDGNIGNGTPHYSDIDGGFRAQGFPGVDLDFITFSNVTDLADTTNETGPYVVNATIVAIMNPPIASTTLFYRVNGSSFSSVAMTPTGGNNYSGSIPGQGAPAEVDYYLRATDSLANPETHPAGAPGNFLSFRVGNVTQFLFTEFEAGNNEGWTVGDTGDNATTGVWVRVDPVGTAAQTEDDHTVNPGTRCWVTGQGSGGGGVGDNDVDTGKTTLKTPVFDAAGLTDPKVRYWRWYSNTQGSNPNQDTFVIDISNNGGANWTNVEVVGPAGAQANGGWYQFQFDITDVIAPTATMQLRFVASDLGGGSIVEAAIDDIEGYDISDGCANPSSYGTGKLNSQLVIPEIGTTGTNSYAINDFAFEVTTLVPNQATLLISGSTQENIPFYGGFLYVGGGIVREAITHQDATGYASVPFPIELTDIGTTRYYQFWYRDPMHSDGTGVGLSNAVAVTYCD